MATIAKPNSTSARTVDVDVDLENNKDDILLSIYDILSEIKSAFPDPVHKYDDISAMAELKKHSSDLLNYIYKQKDGDAIYVSYPKSPAMLNYDWLRMLQEIEEDITAMRGYLCGLLSNHHVEHIRSLRNRATSIVKAATKAPVVDFTHPTRSQLEHNTYRTPYNPPPWNIKAAPVLMLFNDDELRFYYEGIAVPETEKERVQAKYQYNEERLALEDERPLSWRFKNNADLNISKSSARTTTIPRRMKRKRSSTEANPAVKKRG